MVLKFKVNSRMAQEEMEGKCELTIQLIMMIVKLEYDED